MKVRMRVGISGTFDGAPYPGVGEVGEFPDSVAVKLLTNGQAVHVKDEPVVESRPAPAADVEKPEPATVKRPPGRPRKDATK